MREGGVRVRVMLTVYHGHEMWLRLRSPADIDRHANQRVDRDVMYAALEMQLKIFPLITKELTGRIHYDTDFVGEPSRRRP